MTDREKVIKGLECCTTSEVRCFCKNKLCPYFSDDLMCERRLMKDSLELLKEQQQKKAELLKRFDKEIEWAEQARADSACEGEHAWVEHYAYQKSYYENAKSIVENTL